MLDPLFFSSLGFHFTCKCSFFMNLRESQEKNASRNQTCTNVWIGKFLSDYFRRLFSWISWWMSIIELIERGFGSQWIYVDVDSLLKLIYNFIVWPTFSVSLRCKIITTLKPTTNKKELRLSVCFYVILVNYNLFFS